MRAGVDRHYDWLGWGVEKNPAAYAWTAGREGRRRPSAWRRRAGRRGSPEQRADAEALAARGAASL